MAEPSRPADAEQRERAIDPRRSFCVSAPAGSGKTELLVQRLLALLATVQQPEEMLAVTFTRKAAAEMRARVVDALRDADAGRLADAGSEHRRRTLSLAARALARDRALDWRLLDNPNRLQVQTVDSFCRYLAERCPLSSGLAGKVDIVDRPQALYREAASELLAELEHGPGEVTEALEALLAALDNDWPRAQRLLVEMLGRREQWLPLLGGRGVSGETARAALEAGRVAVIQDSLSSLREELDAWIEPLSELLGYALAHGLPGPAESLWAARGLATDADALPCWVALANMLVTRNATWRARPDRRSGFPPGAAGKAQKQAHAELLRALSQRRDLPLRLDELRWLPQARYAAAEWRQLESLTLLLPRLSSHLHAVFARHGEVDFIAMALAAERALGDMAGPSDLALQLGYRLRHILVDEFQDISHSQFRLFERLVDTWAEDNAADPSQPRTLFVVGDPMQSCYGFRQADVGLFLRAQRAGINGMVLANAPLTVNFRSSAKLVDWVNQSFEQAFPVESVARGAVGFTRSSPAPGAPAAPWPADGGLHVFLHKESSARAAGAEAAWVVAKAEALLSRHPDEGVAVLARGRGDLAALLPRLRHAGMSWRAEDMDSLAQRPGVGDLLALTRALLNPADRIAWLAVLRAPWCGLRQAELHAVAGGAAGTGAALWQRIQLAATGQLLELGDDAARRCQHVYRALEPAFAQRARWPLREWLLRAWRALGGPWCLGADEHWRDVECFLGMLDATDRGGDCADLSGLEEQLRARYAESAPDAPGRLQLMTIHKAKGLEFDHVIVLGANARQKTDANPLLLWRERLLSATSPAAPGDAQLLMSALSPVSGEAGDSLYQFLRQEERARARQEETRLLYVAATRARRSLWLCARAQAGPADQPTPTWHAGGMLGAVAPGMRAAEMHSLDESADESAGDSAGDSAGMDEPAAPRLRRLSLACLEDLAPWPEDPGAWEAAPPPPRVDALDRAVGEVVHRAMRWLALQADGSPLPGQASWRGLLRQHGLSGAELSRGAARVAEIVARVSEDERGRWILSSGHREAETELALLHGGRRLVIDRSFVDDAGMRWLIEYKTAAPEAGEESALLDFAVTMTERHLEQLASHAEALLAWRPGPLRCALYFPAVPLFHLVDDVNAAIEAAIERL